MVQFLQYNPNDGAAYNAMKIIGIACILIPSFLVIGYSSRASKLYQAKQAGLPTTEDLKLDMAQWKQSSTIAYNSMEPLSQDRSKEIAHYLIKGCEAVKLANQLYVCEAHLDSVTSSALDKITQSVDADNFTLNLEQARFLSDALNNVLDNSRYNFGTEGIAGWLDYYMDTAITNYVLPVMEWCNS